jgi:Coenzyme PQQ synthesis protein D (PqqD)
VTLVIVGSDVYAAAVDGDRTVLVSARTNQVHQLNSTGTAVWRALSDTAGDLDQALDQLAATYGVERASVGADVSGLLGQLIAARLVEVTP